MATDFYSLKCTTLLVRLTASQTTDIDVADVLADPPPIIQTMKPETPYIDSGGLGGGAPLDAAKTRQNASIIVVKNNF